MRFRTHRRLAALPVLFMLLGGCPPLIPSKPNNQTNDPIFRDQEPNNSLPTATALTLDADDTLRFTGLIDPAGDIDVYALGRLTAGDRLVVDVQRVSGMLMRPF